MDVVVHLALLAEAEEPGINVLLLVGVVLHAAGQGMQRALSMKCEWNKWTQISMNEDSSWERERRFLQKIEKDETVIIKVKKGKQTKSKYE